jgi:hypothetical protein
MKHPVIFLLFLSLNFTARSQGIKPQNVYRVTVTSRYVLEEGERTNRFYAVNQQISDSLGRLHTEIDYDWETRYPDNYRWHYFDSLLMVRTDFFVKEKIEKRIAYDYDNHGNVSREWHYGFQDEDSVLLRTIAYSYNPSGRKGQAEALSNEGRRLYRARFAFDERGTEISRRVTVRRGAPEDGIQRLDREAEYDSLGLLMSETVRLRMSDRTREEHTKKYKYDTHGNIIEILELDDRGSQAARMEYDWQQGRNRLSRIRYYDENDQLEKYLAKRYEIYRTSDRRQRVIDY